MLDMVRTPEQNRKHAAWMREWRKTHKLSGAAKRRQQARTLISQYVKHGSIERQPCYICGARKVEAHHPDHEKQREVIWLCRPHHVALTNNKLCLLMTPQAIAAMKVSACIPIFRADRIADSILRKVTSLRNETS